MLAGKQSPCGNRNRILTGRCCKEVKMRIGVLLALVFASPAMGQGFGISRTGGSHYRRNAVVHRYS